MKKSILIILALVIIGAFAYSNRSYFISNNQIPVPQEEEIKLENKIGILSINKGDGLLTQPSDFILTSDAGEKTFLLSLAINLKKYDKRRVEVAGKLDKENNIFAVENVTPLGLETQTKQKYTNAEFGMKFNYPSIWVIKEELAVLPHIKITITPYEVGELDLSETDHITLERFENKDRLTPAEWLNLDADYNPTKSSAAISSVAASYQKSTIGVGLKDAVKKTIGEGERVEFYVSRDTYMYVFSHDSIDDADKDEYKNAFYDLVGSFEFIPFGTTGGESSALAPIDTISPAVNPPSANVPDVLPEPSVTPPANNETTSNLQPVRQSFITYINAHIKELAPEQASLGGNWYTTKFSIAAPDDKPEEFTGIYVEYEDGHDMRKILLNVTDREKPETVTVAAYFKPGSSTDWEIASGSDSAKSSTKTLVDETGADKTSIKSGMNLINARSYKATIQYPSSWYWAYIEGSYHFSNKSVTAENTLIEFLKDPEALPAAMVNAGEIGGLTAVSGELDGNLYICVQDGAQYCVKGASDYKDTMNAMLATVQEQ